MKKISLLTIPFIALPAFAQFGEINIIDNTAASAGIKRIITADLNNDGFKEIIVTQAYNVDNVAYYPNNNGSFDSKIVIDADLDDPVYVASADFNADGWTDLTVITQTSNQLYVYINDSEGGFERQLIDDDFLLGNGLVTADFNGDGTDDIVAIGQHSIDFYRNNGNSEFTKEHILTTSSSPNVLECMSLDAADMNGDGYMDLVSGETLGGVIYFNNGEGVFTPLLFTDNLFITTFIHASDMNNDGFKDIILRHSGGNVNLYINDGEGNMAYSSTLFSAQILESMHTEDVNNDGYNDIYTAYANKARVMINNSDETFEADTILYEDDTMFINQAAIADIDNDGEAEFIWSAAGSTLAYHKNNTLGITENHLDNIKIYPNPAKDYINITLSYDMNTDISIYNSIGQKVMEKSITTTQTIDVSGLVKGVYIVQITEGATDSVYSFKLVKE